MAKQDASPTPATWRKPLLVHGGLILSFLLVLIIYFRPAFEGKVLLQNDLINYRGMAKEVQDFRAETGEEALWTNRMFGGMPAFQISARYHNNLFYYLDKALTFGLPRPVNYYFLMFIGFYGLLLTMKLNPYESALGAAAFTLSSYFFIIMEPGHTSKANAIAYMAPVIAGVLLAYRGKLVWGGMLTLFALGLEINANHYQITYYLAMVIGILGLVFLVDAIQKKTLPDFAKSSGVLILVAILALGPNLGRMWTTYQYAEDTMRGPTELTSEDQDINSGLDKEYALRWSYGVAETFTLLVPNFHGGSSGTDVGTESETYASLSRLAGAQQARRLVQRWPTYWGNQPSTSGPVYVGALVCFLFVLGLLLIPGRFKWWLVIATALTVMLSWGRNFMPLTDLFFYYFPAYNKFRAVSMLLVVAEFTMPLLGALALGKFIRAEEEEGFDREKLQKQLYIALGITGGLALVFALLGPMLFSFTVEGTYNSDTSTLSRIGLKAGSAEFNDLMDALVADRINLMRGDALRSLAFIVAAGGLLWLYLQKRIKANWVYVGFALIILVDMIPVNRRYLNDDIFVTQRQYDRQYTKTKAIQSILQDKTPQYRVLNLSTGLSGAFNEAKTSYYLRSVGGYHAAKLRRYQDLISIHIQSEMQTLVGTLQSQQQGGGAPFELVRAMSGLKVLNMLNTKYFIIDPNGTPLQNPTAYGPAWFVSDTVRVANADQEIAAIKTTDLQAKAIIDQRFEDRFAGTDWTAGADSSATLTLTSYKPNEVSYKSAAAKSQVAVFSEIYYNDEKGWNAYLDGEKVPHFRTNYVLRGMVVPAGQHEIVFKFEPKSYQQGEFVSLLASIICLLLLGGAIWIAVKNNQNKETPA